MTSNNDAMTNASNNAEADTMNSNDSNNDTTTTKEEAPPAAVESGTKKYMNGYKKESVDGCLRLGNVVPDFFCDTTQGHWDSFLQWKANKWAILFSHPKDFTPVCTTEILELAQNYSAFARLDCQLAVVSVDAMEDHHAWSQDILALSGGALTEIPFPIVADPKRDIATLYGMIDPWMSDKQGMPLTIRAVFFISPENQLMLSMNYPASVGRSIPEIIRSIEALQLSYKRSVATPANWPQNEMKIPSVPSETKPNEPTGNKNAPPQDTETSLESTENDGTTATTTTTSSSTRGAVFILPTVTPDDAAQHFPNYQTTPVPSGKPYLRTVSAEYVAGTTRDMTSTKMATQPQKGTTTTTTTSGSVTSGVTTASTANSSSTRPVKEVVAPKQRRRRFFLPFCSPQEK